VSHEKTKPENERVLQLGNTEQVDRILASFYGVPVLGTTKRLPIVITEGILGHCGIPLSYKRRTTALERINGR
jgi:hypothetical protein